MSPVNGIHASIVRNGCIVGPRRNLSTESMHDGVPPCCAGWTMQATPIWWASRADTTPGEPNSRCLNHDSALILVWLLGVFRLGRCRIRWLNIWWLNSSGTCHARKCQAALLYIMHLTLSCHLLLIRSHIRELPSIYLTNHQSHI